MKILKALNITALVTKIFTIIFAIVMGVGIVATPIILSNEAQSAINNRFGIQTSKKIQVEGEDVEPIEHYKTDYMNIKELKDDAHEISKQVQTEGAVLLMNNGALPLSKGNSVNLYDVTSADPVWGGFGSGQAVITGTEGRGSYGVYQSQSFPYDTSKPIAQQESRPSFLKSFQKAGLVVNADLWNWYNTDSGKYKRILGSDWQKTQNINGAPWSAVKASGHAEKTADAAIFVLGRVGGENVDRQMLSWSGDPSGVNNVKSYLKLSTREIETLDALKEMKGKNFQKLILLINSSNQPELDWLTKNNYDFDAAVWIGGLGQDGIDGVGDLLVGDANFSGRLSTVFWNRHAYNPAMANFGGYSFGTSAGDSKAGLMNTKDAGDDISDMYVAYQEGMYLGYRYTETRYEDVVMNTPNALSNANAQGEAFDYNKVVAYPFGFGLSYTTFDYKDISFKKDVDNKLTDISRPNASSKHNQVRKTTYKVSVTVENTGSMAGKEVVQVYMQRPYDAATMADKMEIPSAELVGFAKTKKLEPKSSYPGDPGKYSETVTIDVDEKYFATFDAHDAETFVLNPGKYYLALGKDSHDAVNNILNAKSYSEDNMTASRGSAQPAKGTAGMASMVLDQATKDIVKYSVSDVTGNEIKNLFNSADINFLDPSNNHIQYVTRSNWSDTAKFINDADDQTEATQTAQVKLYKSKVLQDRMTENRTSLGEDDGEYPEYEKTPSTGKKIVLAEMAVRNLDGSMYYKYDDPMWDEFIDQLSWKEQVELLISGKRHTKEVTSVAKPLTSEINGPVGFCVQYEESSLLKSNIKDSNGAASKAGDEKDSGIYGLARIGVFEDENGNKIPRRTKAERKEEGSKQNWYEKKYESVMGAGSILETVIDPDVTAYPTAFPSNPVVAATFNRELIQKVGEMIGEDALWAGYSGIYGTGLNIIRSAHGGRAFEYYSEDGFLSGEIASAWTVGVQSKGCYVYNKHFALNDQEYARKGVSTFVNEQTFREIYLRAFEIPIVKGNARAMMGAYNRIGVEFAPSVKTLYTDWLRGETGFDGFTVTDWWSRSNDAGYNNYYMQLSRTLVAGNDLPDGNLPLDQLDRYNPNGDLRNAEVAWAMRESAKRIMYTVADSNAMNGIDVNTRVIPLDVAWPRMVENGKLAGIILFSTFAFLYVASAGTAYALTKLKVF